jgi:GntR family transcriptional regulator
VVRTPLHREIKRLLLDEIEQGVFPEGSRLTPEVELARRFGVSRPTVRQALSALVDAGVLSRRPGRGTMVQPKRLGYPVGRLMSFSDEFAGASEPAHAGVIERTVVAADADLADRLEVATGARVFRLKRVRYVGQRPVAWQQSQIPFHLVPGIEALDFSTASLYSTLRERFHLVISRAEEVIRAGLAAPFDSERLGIPLGAAVFRVERRGFSDAGELVELVDSVYPSDRYEIRLSLRA